MTTTAPYGPPRYRRQRPRFQRQRPRLGRRRPRLTRALVVVAAGVGLVLGPPVGAGAHQREKKANVVVQTPHCLEGRVTMRHDEVYFREVLGTIVKTDIVHSAPLLGTVWCTPWEWGRPAGYLKTSGVTVNTSNGTWCTWSGWAYNADGSGSVTTYGAGFSWDVDERPLCGAGHYKLAGNHYGRMAGWVGGPLSTSTHYFH